MFNITVMSSTIKTKIVIIKILFFFSLLINFTANLNAQTLFAQYPFSGNANDAVGSNNGIPNGVSLTSDRSGNLNSAYHFTGIDPSRITLTNTLNFGNNNFTISAWFRTSSTDAYRGIHIFSNGGAFYLSGVQLGLNYPGYSQKLFFAMAGSGSINTVAHIISVNSYTDNQWHFVKINVNRDLNIIQMFVDNTQESIVKIPGSGGTIESNGKDLDISCLNELSGNAITTSTIGDYDYGDHTFIGDIDEVSFYVSTPSSSSVSINISPGRDLCANYSGTITLSVNGASTNAPIKWYVGSCSGSPVYTGNPYSPTTPSVGITKYYIQIGACSNSPCIKDSITVYPASGVKAFAGDDKQVCHSTANLNANNTPGNWSVYSGNGIFSDNSAYNTTVSNLSPGLNKFIWTVQGNYCGFESSDTVTLNYFPFNFGLICSTSPDTACFGTPKQIEVKVNNGGTNGYTYSWTSSDNTVHSTSTLSMITVTPSNSTTYYYVTVLDNSTLDCTQKDTVVIHAIPEQLFHPVPNLITPNNDSKNEFFELIDTNKKTALPGTYLEISNRWGETIYKNSSYDNSWNAIDLSDGIYYYYIKSGCGNKKYKGFIQVLR